MSETQFSSEQVATLAGITQRQLQWWDEQAVVKPRLEGHRRRYDFSDALEMAVVAELKRKGMSLQRIRRLMPDIRLGLQRTTAGFWHPTIDYFLFIQDNTPVLIESNRAVIAEMLGASKGPITAVCLTDLANRLRTM